MKNIFVVAVVCVVAFGCNRATMPSTTPYANAEINNEEGDKILAGHCAKSILRTMPYKEWYDRSYDPYAVDPITVQQLTPSLENMVMEIFLGSWCGDTKREVPRMMKILEAADFDTTNIKLIFVDNSTKTYKQSPQHEEAGKNIFRVPTFILYENKKEIGRIVQDPVGSLEKDLLKIAQRQPYTPEFKAVAYWYAQVNDRNKTMTDKSLETLAAQVRPICKNMGEFNAYGYVQLAQKRYAEAINVFRLNTFIYPTDPGTYDSLGEAYYKAGNKEAAIKNYKKVLQLKPGDENATKMLKEIK